MANAKRITALGKAKAGFVAHQIAMVIGGRDQLERPPKQNLPGCRFQQVGTAHDFRDVHFSIIHNNGELIRRYIIAAPNNEVAKISPGRESLNSKVYVGEAHLLAVWHAKTPIHPGRTLELCRIIA